MEAANLVDATELTSDLIMDIGLNVGQDSGFYLSQGYQVVAVEANPILATQVSQQFHSAVESGKLKIVNVGIGKVESVADFWVCEQKTEFSSFHPQIAGRDSYSYHSTKVPVVRFASILKRFGIPLFLKIDIEGNDFLCLQGLSPQKLPKYISVESECPLTETDSAVEDGLSTLEKLRSLGYRSFKLIDQYTFCSLSLPMQPHQFLDGFAQKLFNRRPLRNLRGTGLISRHLFTRRRLERKLNWKFPPGSSGPWGEDTPGNWIGFEAARQVYSHYRDQHFSLPNAPFHSFWCDWHAKRD
jgi:FkbM family methyltransferase